MCKPQLRVLQLPSCCFRVAWGREFENLENRSVLVDLDHITAVLMLFPLTRG